MLEFDWLEFFIHHVMEKKIQETRKLMLFLNRQNIFHRQSLNNLLNMVKPHCFELG